jgi:hypothetical protein
MIGLLIYLPHSLADILIRGRARDYPKSPELWLAVEVSATIDRHDVERAERRAALLRKLDYRAVAVVTGEKITEGGTALAEANRVLLLQNGRKQPVEAALAQALAV